MKDHNFSSATDYIKQAEELYIQQPNFVKNAGIVFSHLFKREQHWCLLSNLREAL